MEEDDEDQDDSEDFALVLGNRPYQVPCYEEVDVSSQFVNAQQVETHAGTPVERAQAILGSIPEEDRAGVNMVSAARRAIRSLNGDRKAYQCQRDGDRAEVQMA